MILFYQAVHVFAVHSHYHFFLFLKVQDNDETIWHQRKDSLLLAEHNLLCEAFSMPSLLGYDLFFLWLLSYSQISHLLERLR